VSFADDEHPVGDLRPGGEYEAFGIGVRRGASGRDLHGFDTGAGQGRVEGCGELPGPVADEEPEVGGVIAEVHQGLRICCVLHSPSGCAVTPRMRTQRLPTSITNKQYSRWSVTAQSTWQKSMASMVAADCACRESRPRL
jgi:hypothetical protein